MECLLCARKHPDPALKEITVQWGKWTRRVYWERVVCTGDDGHSGERPGARSEDPEDSPAEVILCFRRWVDVSWAGRWAGEKNPSRRDNRGVSKAEKMWSHLWSSRVQTEGWGTMKGNWKGGKGEGQGGKNEGQGGKGEGHGCSGSKTSPVGIPPCRVRLNLVIAFVL